MRMYSEYYEEVYPFAEYGDYENYFISIGYLIRSKSFKSRVGACLINETAANGRPIFKNANIDFSKYALLNETLEPKEGGWTSVKELYGYAPEQSYVTYSAEPVMRPGMEDDSGYKEFPVGLTSYNQQLDRFTMTLSSIDTLAIGDMLSFVARPTQGNRAEGPAVAVISIEGNSVTVPAFQITFPATGGTWTKGQTANFINNPSNWGWAGSMAMVRTALSREPLTLIASVRNEISFHRSFPALDSRLIISLGNNETDTITSSTSPNTSTWKQMIADGEYYNVQDATVEMVFPNAFYKKTVKQTLAR